MNVAITGVSWKLYEKLLALRGKERTPRMYYLEGTLHLEDVPEELLAVLCLRYAAVDIERVKARVEEFNAGKLSALALAGEVPALLAEIELLRALP